MEALKQQLAQKSEENETVNRQLEDMHSSYSQARQKAVTLEESNDKLSSENNNLKRQVEKIETELVELRDIAERRRTQIEDLHAEAEQRTQLLGIKFSSF